MEVLGIFANFGWAGVAAAVAWMVYTGRLVPGKVVDRIVKQSEANAEIWERAYQMSEEARKQQAGIVHDSVEAVRTTEHVVRALNEAAGGGQ